MIRSSPRALHRLRSTSLSLLAASAFLVPATGAQVTQQAPAPPIAERRTRVDTLHGDVRRDDYFWLRVKSDPAVKQYLEAENAYAEGVLAPLKGLREQLYNEMLGRIKQTDLSVPFRRGDYFYYTRTVEGQQYPIFARKRGSLDAPEQVTVDLNELAKGQVFMSLGAYQVSDDGNLLAFSIDSTGYRQYALRVKDLRTGERLPDAAARVTSVAWAADNRTLFYTVEDSVSKRSHRLYQHVLGSPDHELLYEEKDERFSLYVHRTRSRQFVVWHTGSLTSSEMRILPADNPSGEWKLVSARVPEREYDIDHHGDKLYIRVNDKGRNFRLVTAPVSDPSEKNWTEVIPHRADVMLEGVELFANHLVTSERRNALDEIVITDLRTGRLHKIAFPEPVYAAGTTSNAEFNTNTLRYNYTSFVTPNSVFDYNMDTRQQTLLKEQPVLGGYDKTRYTSERIYARAKDGTRIPISLVYRKDVRRDGRAPALLEAYGSYGYPSSVYFSSNDLSLLDRGMVLALAHIRGGGDMGKAWHDAGRMMNKLNTFNDFIAAAEHLVNEKYTSKARLVIQGGSAGGLLMGAVTNLRPDLFKAVVSHVPFVDVVNTMLDETLPLTVGEFEEWGNPKKKDEYEYMKRYDPYGNLARKDYPAMLVKTSFNDSQVMYHEPAKYVARLRSLKTDKNPLIFVTNMGAGHGGASGRYDRLREIALDYAFMLWQVGLAGGPTTP
ncbi:MAG: S9 family peptidase [Gemmatimonadota bacterium]|nr:S9 family peptidase [Gemmatimonadota bacterium]